MARPPSESPFSRINILFVFLGLLAVQRLQPVLSTYEFPIAGISGAIIRRIVTIFGWLAVVGFFLSRAGIRWRDMLGLGRGFGPIAPFLIASALTYWISGTSYLLEYLGFAKWVSSYVQVGVKAAEQGAVAWPMLIVIIDAAALTPFVEEVIMRGVLLNRLCVRWSFGLSAAVVSLLFALLHPPSRALDVFAFSMMACVLYAQSGSLVRPWLFHVMFNSISIVCTLVPAIGSADYALRRGYLEMTWNAAPWRGMVLEGVSYGLVTFFLWRIWPESRSLPPEVAPSSRSETVSHEDRLPERGSGET